MPQEPTPQTWQQEPQGAPSLASTYVHLDAETSAQLIPVDDSFWDELIAGERRELERGRLVTQFDFSSDWSSWEMHPNGDELVILLEGDAELLLELPQGVVRTRLRTPGEFVRVPRGAWHTAHTHVHCSMVFVTAGAGTQHRPA